tara:strand:+ start:38973 stop:39161 length:189 start_codon:yes stop_codon:yes gene_type:complete
MELYWIGFSLMVAGVVIAGILPEYVTRKPACRMSLYIGGSIIVFIGVFLAVYAALDEWPAAL